VAHYDAIGALRSAVYQGDLAGVREAAGRMEGGEPARRDPEAEGRLHAAVGFLVAAEDGDEAAEGLAEVGKACGACHRSLGVTWPYPASELPDPETRSFHVQAQNVLWEALVAPDGGRWTTVRGAIASSADLGTGQPERTASIRAAITSSTPEEAFGAFAASCASCHARAGTAPGAFAQPPFRK